jgi:hypothetical protein
MSELANVSERKRRVRVQIGRRRDASPELSESGRGNHRRVVGRQLKAGQERRNFAPPAALLEVGAQAAVRRYPARNPHALRLMAPRGVEQPIDQRRHDDSLEAGANVCDLRLRKRRDVDVIGALGAD